MRLPWEQTTTSVICVKRRRRKRPEVGLPFEEVAIE
jgi:hypothetical protein